MIFELIYLDILGCRKIKKNDEEVDEMDPIHVAIEEVKQNKGVSFFLQQFIKTFFFLCSFFFLQDMDLSAYVNKFAEVWWESDESWQKVKILKYKPPGEVSVKFVALEGAEGIETLNLKEEKMRLVLEVF